MDDRLTELPARELIQRLATSDPVPGGGSASALAGAMGAALVQMVVALTTGRPAATEAEDELAEIAAAALTIQSDLLRLTEVDAAAYDAVVRARRLPHATELEQRARTLQVGAATREATLAPLETLRQGAALFALAERLAPIASRHAISDVGVAALLAATAMRGAAMNVRINLPYLPDTDDMAERAVAEVDRLLAGLDSRGSVVEGTVAERMA